MIMVMTKVVMTKDMTKDTTRDTEKIKDTKDIRVTRKEAIKAMVVTIQAAKSKFF